MREIKIIYDRDQPVAALTAYVLRLLAYWCYREVSVLALNARSRLSSDLDKLFVANEEILYIFVGVSPTLKGIVGTLNESKNRVMVIGTFDCNPTHLSQHHMGIITKRSLAEYNVISQNGMLEAVDTLCYNPIEDHRAHPSDLKDVLVEIWHQPPDIDMLVFTYLEYFASFMSIGVDIAEVALRSNLTKLRYDLCQTAPEYVAPVRIGTLLRDMYLKKPNYKGHDTVLSHIIDMHGDIDLWDQLFQTSNHSVLEYLTEGDALEIAEKKAAIKATRKEILREVGVVYVDWRREALDDRDMMRDILDIPHDENYVEQKTTLCFLTQPKYQLDTSLVLTILEVDKPIVGVHKGVMSLETGEPFAIYVMAYRAPTEDELDALTELLFN